ncbi:glycosyltransferase [Microbacteriaceae bacterium 4G12]
MASSKSVAVIGTRGYPSYYGGFETAVRRLAPYLADQGWDVTVYGRAGATTDNDPDLDPRITRKVTAGLETQSLSTLSYGLSACIDAALRKPDVALVMNVANGFWLPILRARRIPVLVNVDGIEWERAKWSTLAKWVFHTSAKWTARFGTRMIYDAHEIGRRWKQEFKLDGAFIPYGGDIPEPLPVEPGLEDRGYVLVVARFVPENTIVEFIEAAEALSQTRDVVIVGSSGYGGELDERVGKLAERAPRVTWLGHVRDDRKLMSLWQHAGAYFHGHSVGGTNPALVQAMACGAPIVARDTAYTREVLGENALFVQPDGADIAEKIETLLSDRDLQERLSEGAVERAREHYSWELVCSSYARELDDAAARSRGGRR